MLRALSRSAGEPVHGTENKIAIYNCLLGKLVRLKFCDSIAAYLGVPDRAQIGAANGRDTPFIPQRIIDANLGTLEAQIKFPMQFSLRITAIVS